MRALATGPVLPFSKLGNYTGCMAKVGAKMTKMGCKTDYWGKKGGIIWEEKGLQKNVMSNCTACCCQGHIQ